MYNSNVNDYQYDEEHYDDLKRRVTENDVYCENGTDGSELNQPITLTEIQQSIKRSKDKKAPGIDELPA